MSKIGTYIVVGIMVVACIGGGLWYMNSGQQSVVEVPTPVATSTSAVVHEVIGTSVQGRTIDAYTYLPAQAGGKGAKHLVFVGGIHGGYEWNSVLLAYQFMDYLEANPTFVPAGISITVIPSANPDGLFKVIGKEGRFTLADVPNTDAAGDPTGLGRFNANNVDLNRNFACKWKPESTWRSKKVSAGTEAFSEPEAKAIRDFALENTPEAFVFWHSQSNAVYASECEKGILPETLSIMNVYSKAAGYKAVATFDAYPVSGDAEGWLASIGIPAITVELATHATVEWDKNRKGIEALLEFYK
jgi:predicted deacylase